MTAPMVADLETGAAPSTASSTPVSEPSSTPTPSSTDASSDRSFESLFDKALDSEPGLGIDAKLVASGEQSVTSGVDRGDGRDTRGQFAPKTPAEQAAAAATQTRPGAPPPTAAANAQTPAAPTAPATDAAPFRYRAMGTTHDFKGSTLDKDGNVTIKAEAIPLLRQAMNALHVSTAETFPTLERAQQENTRLTQRIAEMESASTLNDTKAGQLVDNLTKIMDEPDDTRAMNQLWQLRQAWPSLVAKSEAVYWQNQAQRGKTTPAEAPKGPAAGAPTSADRGVPSRDDAIATTADYLEHAKLDQQFRDLGPQDWQQFKERSDRTPYAYLRPATAEEAQQYRGVRQGEVVFDSDAFYADLAAHAAATRGARDTAKRQADIAADQARRTTPTIDAPPTASGTQVPPKGERRITSAKDWKEWAESDDI